MYVTVALIGLGLLQGCVENARTVEDPIVARDHPLAAGTVIERIAVYQGVEVLLHDAAAEPPARGIAVPIVEQRAAAVRVHVAPEPDQGFSDRTVAVILDVGGAGTKQLTLADVVTVSGTPQDDRGAAAWFQVPAEWVTPDLALDVSVHEVTPQSDLGTPDPDLQTWSSPLWGLDTVNTGSIRLHIVPVRYRAGGGAGRLPDTSPAALTELRDGLYAEYPVQSVEVVLEEELWWTESLTTRAAWSRLLEAVQILRAESTDAQPSSYFYGLVPFVDGAALGGVSLLADDLTDEASRASTGMADSGHTLEILLHELGHAHGRRHAPCGDPQHLDGFYPHALGQIGTWGYDLRTGFLYDPSRFYDFMSYCDPTWVSDYTFMALANRLSVVPTRRAAVTEWQLLRVSADGAAELGSVMKATWALGGKPVQVQLRDQHGATIGTTQGTFRPFDHLEGGFAWVPPVGPQVAAAFVRL